MELTYVNNKLQHKQTQIHSRSVHMCSNKHIFQMNYTKHLLMTALKNKNKVFLRCSKRPRKERMAKDIQVLKKPCGYTCHSKMFILLHLHYSFSNRVFPLVILMRSNTDDKNRPDSGRKKKISTQVVANLRRLVSIKLQIVHPDVCHQLLLCFF